MGILEQLDWWTDGGGVMGWEGRGQVPRHWMNEIFFLGFVNGDWDGGEFSRWVRAGMERFLGCCLGWRVDMEGSSGKVGWW